MVYCSKKIKNKCNLPHCKWNVGEGCKNVCEEGKEVNPKTGRCKNIEDICANGKIFDVYKRKCVEKEKITKPKNIFYKKSNNNIQGLCPLKIFKKSSYGCVVQPPIEDKYINYINNEYKNKKDDDIGKLFVYSNDFKEHFKLLKEVNLIDPNHLFTVEMKAFGKINGNVIRVCNDEIKECLKSHNIKQSYYEIVVENAGVPLNNDFTIRYNQFIFLFTYFLKGMMTLHNNGKIHGNIIENNILINSKKISLINFNYMKNANDVFASKHNDLLKNNYKYFPPEFYLAYVYNNIITSDMSSEQIRYKLSKALFDKLNETNFFDRYQNKDKIQQGVRDFINSVLENKLTRKSDIFNNKVAFKADVYALGHIIGTFYRKIKFSSNQEKADKQKQFIKNIYMMCLEYNPYKRISVPTLFNVFIREIKNNNSRAKTMTGGEMAFWNQTHCKEDLPVMNDIPDKEMPL